MGVVFGKQTVAEPAFDLLLNREHHLFRNGDVNTAYELRKYGERFVAETTYVSDDSMENVDSPFMSLAQYIGVFGTPQNDGNEAMAMTAPVVIDNNNNNDGTKIAMTAPVITETTTTAADEEDSATSSSSSIKTMQFVLPAEYDERNKIPNPTNPNVHIKAIPAAYGAVHQFTGTMNEERNQRMAKQLANQLHNDGIIDITEDNVQFQFWGYNPPFTLPMFRRNEVWVELTEQQVNELINKYSNNNNPSN